MKTQIELARGGLVTEQMQTVASDEKIDAAIIHDLSKYPERRDRDKQAATARRGMRWDDLEDLLLFPEVARSVRDSRRPEQSETCTMCGDFCAMKKGMEVFSRDVAGDKCTP